MTKVELLNAQELLLSKITLLEELNNDTQLLLRFAGQTKVKGFVRVLGDRDMRLKKLVTLNATLAFNYSLDTVEAQNTDLCKNIEKIRALQQQLVRNNDLLNLAAHKLYKEIKDDMRRLSEYRKVRSAYDLQGIKMAGRRINSLG